MQTPRRSIPRRISSAIVTVLVAFAALTGCAQVTGAPAAPDRAAQAWTDRLNGLAQEAAQQALDEARRQRANDAYSLRLTEQAQEAARRQRANDAYSLRLTEQARAHESEQQARERADQAWTDRLNGLAEHLNADR